MKVLLVCKSFKKGGGASGASNLANALRSVGTEVVRFDAYAALRLSPLRAMRFAERALERVLYEPELHCLRLGPPAFLLHALCREHDPDVIQLCDVSGNVIRFADLTGLPCPVVHRMSDFWPYHGPHHYAVEPNGGPRSARWLLRRTVFSGHHLPDARVAPSQWLAERLAEQSKDGRPIRVIRNAVNIPVAPRIVPPKLDEVRFGFISNKVLDPRKCVRRLLAPLEALAATGVRPSLHVFGQIPSGDRFTIPGVKVEYRGRFERGALPRVFEKFDILLCPSRLDNSPNVLCEALAHGRPVIAQSGSGMESYLDEERGALVDLSVDAGSARREFLDACHRLARDYAHYSTNAAAFAAEHLSPQVIGSAYLALYRELGVRGQPSERPRNSRPVSTSVVDRQRRTQKVKL